MTKKISTDDLDVEEIVGAPKQTARGDKVLLLSEVDIAEAFAAEHAGGLRFVAKLGQWLRYSHRCWREEPTLMAFDLVRNMCRELTHKHNSKKTEAKTILSAKTIAGVERIAKADRRIAATADQWDTDNEIFNTRRKSK